MSALTNSIKPLRTENVLDPRLEAMKYGQEKLKWGVFKGCQNQNWVQQQANSYSTAGATWNFNTQSENVLIDRRIYARMQFQISFTGTSPIGQPLLNDEADSPRAFPLGMITQSLKASINGTSFESQYSDVLEALLRYNNPFEQRNHDLSQTPSMLDKHQVYADGVGGVRNPLGLYDNGSYEIGRGAFRVDSIVNPVSVDGVTPTTSIVVFTVTEPLLLSPFLYSCRHLQSGLYGVKNIGVQFTFKAGQLDRMWSHAVTAGVTITGVTVAIGSGTTAPPTLLVNYLNPPLLDSIGEKPQAPVYQYYKTDTYINDFSQTLAPNASGTFANNAIQLSTIPSSIYLWFTRPNNAKSYITSDTAFRINSLSVNFLNFAGQFSTMTINDLYSMACKNGCELSWTEFNGLTQNYSSGTVVGLTGSFLKLDVEDLAMPDNMASGVNVNSQLSITANITNINQAATLGVQCNVVCVYDGVCTVVDGNAISQVGIITQEDVVETRKSSAWVDFSKAQRMYGGSFLAKLGSLAKAAPSIVHGASDVLKSLGLGAVGGELEMDDMEEGGALVGGARPKRCPKGSRKVCEPKGGAAMSLADLRKRLMA